MTESVTPPVPPYTPPDNAAVPAKRTGPSRVRRFGDGLGTVIGEFFGFVVLFPLMMATIFTGISLLFDTQAYEQVFVFTFGVFALIGAFILAAKWFGILFIRYWPLFVLGIGGFIAWKALT